MRVIVGFRIDVKGIDEIQKKLKELEHSIDPNTFNEWADRVGKTAKQLCNDPQCKHIKLTKTGQGQVNFEFTDKEAVDCAINAIKRHLQSMPLVQQEIFKRVISQFETKKREMSA